MMSPMRWPDYVWTHVRQVVVKEVYNLENAWVLGEAYGTRGFDPLENLMRAKWFEKEGGAAIDTSSWGSFGLEESKGYDPAYVGHQDGLMEADKIDGLPGQPAGVKFD
ncbi:hypothetical protein MRB53_001147 [Persea americana]|uniref:Uncharacterized protein n=1 Tax=Persea americana TaxID=3435 RepID=A0ACC2MR05_PERAE|nr:hypothetical protein MRB53_001147 [Persea americana]